MLYMSWRGVLCELEGRCEDSLRRAYRELDNTLPRSMFNMGMCKVNGMKRARRLAKANMSVDGVESYGPPGVGHRLPHSLDVQTYNKETLMSFNIMVLPYVFFTHTLCSMGKN